MFRNVINRRIQHRTQSFAALRVKQQKQQNLQIRRKLSMKHRHHLSPRPSLPSPSRHTIVRIMRYSQNRSRRQRNSSPIYPETHNRNKSMTKTLPAEYEINSEISSLANQLVKNRRTRLLPPISIPQTSGSVEWPKNVPTFVISINPTRQQRFHDRFQHCFTHFEGTNGKTIDESKWRRDKRLVSLKLKRGEIGCYDSHLRLWKMLVENEIPMAIICEDDVNLSGNAQQSQYLNTLLSEAKQAPFDVLYLSWFRPAGGTKNTAHTRIQWCFCQHWAYVVTLGGLKKLLADQCIQKINLPVDVALWEAHCRGVVRNIVAYPPLTLTTGERSDTRNLR
jgi:hypothetical protein